MGDDSAPLLSSPPSLLVGDRGGNNSHEGTSNANINVEAQEIVVDDDLRIWISGYRISWVKLFFYRLLCICSGGLAYLACRWFPKLELKLTASHCPFSSAQIIVVKNDWGELTMETLAREKVESGDISDFFPDMDPSTLSSMSRSPAVSIETLSQLVFFDHRYMRFILHPVTGLFSTVQYWKDARWTSVATALEGIDGAETVKRRRMIFGENVVAVKEKPTFKLLVDEVLHPFFIFQLASMILWSLDEYYYYAGCILLITVMSTTSTLIETKQAMKRLREMSRFSCNVKVWRGGVWWEIKSDDMVPGDIFEVGSASTMPILPCDSILVDGDCIVNESMLTGESIPVSKTPVTDEELKGLDFWNEDPASTSKVSRFFLFSGTKVIRARCGNVAGFGARDSDAGLHFNTTASEPGALAMVARVGFNTTKGALVRSILYPKPHTFQFYRDSFRFIGVLALIAVLGFMGSVYNFLKLGMSWRDIVVRALDLITIVVPPALPATMAVGISFSINRLRKMGIYCISPPRVNIGGKLEVMCFDKTGTLTEEGLDLLGFRFTVPSESDALLTSTGTPTTPDLSSDGSLRFSDLYRSVDDVVAGPYHSTVEANLAGATPFPINPAESSRWHTRRPSGSSVALAARPGHPNGNEQDFPYPMIICAMATCHSLKVVDHEIIGDPMDLKMFEYTGWHIEEGGSTAGGLKPNGNGSSPIGRRVPPRSNGMSAAGMDGMIQMVIRPPGDMDLSEVVRESFAEIQIPPNAYDPGPLRLHTELGVVRSFEFVSRMRRMSVIVKRLRYSRDSLSFNSPVDAILEGLSSDNGSLQSNSNTLSNYGSSLNGYTHVSPGLGPSLGKTRTGMNIASPKEFEVFVKGAPEVLRSICNPRSIPSEYDSLLKMYAHRGYRVIALAWRKLENVPWMKVMKMRREEIERDLDFLGFVIFENKLKPSTTAVVSTLKNAKIRQIMCTGDNILTAISVSRECGLVLPSNTVFVPRIVAGNGLNPSEEDVKWEDVDSVEDNRRTSALDPRTLKVVSVNNVNLLTSGKSGDYALAVTGDVFQHMLEYAHVDSFNRMLIKGQVYARMSPEQKQLLVERLQELGYCVGFCGDGANDCGALKAADVGVSLSEAEASVAAPFTSRTTNVTCVPHIIREGRSALVTSFGSFKFMAVYSLIQFTSVSLLYALGSNLADFQFLFIDMALIIPIAVFMSESGPNLTLNPKRPTASLVSKKVLSSMLGQVAVQAGLQFAVFFWIRSQPYYQPPDVDVGDKMFKCYENTAVFLLSCYQYVAVAIAFCDGPPYRMPVWHNFNFFAPSIFISLKYINAVQFVFTTVLILAVTIMITLYPPSIALYVLDLVTLPFEGRVQLLTIGLANIFLTLFVNRYISLWIAKLVGFIGLKFSELTDRQTSSTDVEAVALLAPEAKMFSRTTRAIRRRWMAKGKKYKVVEQDLSL
ncbi:hypothetical protein HDU76_002562 [Blyttiomyces sp. JEL0837]|nr:hypothetical protein HDU76_002562 [Blyttiomyces sp. JEL0837]